MVLPAPFYVLKVTAASIGQVLVLTGFSGGYPVLTAKPISEVRAEAARTKH
jgi:hypothetical protein